MLIVDENLRICLLHLSNQIFVAFFFLKKIDIRFKNSIFVIESFFLHESQLFDKS